MPWSRRKLSDRDLVQGMHFNELSTDIVQITLSVVLEIVGHAQPIDREQSIDCDGHLLGELPERFTSTEQIVFVEKSGDGSTFTHARSITLRKNGEGTRAGQHWPVRSTSILPMRNPARLLSSRYELCRCDAYTIVSSCRAERVFNRIFSSGIASR